MIELLELPSDGVIGVKIDGKIQQADIQAVETGASHFRENMIRREN